MHNITNSSHQGKDKNSQSKKMGNFTKAVTSAFRSIKNHSMSRASSKGPTAPGTDVLKHGLNKSSIEHQ